MKYELPFEKVKRKILTRVEAKTDSRLGCKPKDRSVENLIKFGIVNINKPSGPTKVR